VFLAGFLHIHALLSTAFLCDEKTLKKIKTVRKEKKRKKMFILAII